MQIHLLVLDTTWAGPWAERSNPRSGTSSCWSGRYRARASRAAPSCDGPGRAGATLTCEKMMGRDGPGREILKTVMGWAGQRLNL